MDKNIQIIKVRQEDKLWGMNYIMHIDNVFQACHITIKKGGFCSNHRHTHKWNQFYIISGKLAVELFKEGDKAPYSILYLGPNDSIKVMPGVNHKFHAMEDTEAIEIYSVNVSEEDILREDTGGMS
jgi:mannose-6-phosphate isomerase-like protein (cupin superfamily)